jgi:hypothetical protein
MSESKSVLLGALRRGAGFVFVPANPFRAVSHTARDLEVTGRRLTGIGRSALGAEPVDPDTRFLADIPEPRQRFRTAMRHYGVTAADLPRIEAGAASALWTWAVVSVLALAWAIVSIRIELDGGILFTALASWGIAAACLARAARASFRLWQVRQRALRPVSDWLRDPASWLDGGGTAAVALLLAAGAAWTGLAPHSALAQASPVDTQAVGNLVNQIMNATGQRDLSFEWMRRLFPGTIEFWAISSSSPAIGAQGSNADVLQPIFQVLNSILCFLGAMTMCWHTVCGMVATAHTGKVLGDRWHTTWAPIRVVMGVGLVAPVKGYCMMQILVINLFLAGYSVANLEWNTYVATMLSPAPTTLVPPAIDASQSLATQVLQAETCLAVMKGFETNDGSLWTSLSLATLLPSQPKYVVPQSGGAPLGGGAAMLWDYGPVCGNFKLTSSTSSLATAWTTAMNALNPNVNGSLTNEINAYIAFDQARAAALDTFIMAVRNSGLPQALAQYHVIIGTTFAPPTPQAQSGRDMLTTVMTAAGAYNDTMMTAAKTMADSLDVAGRANFAATSQALGWASAGAMSFTLGRLSANAVDHVTGAMPVPQSINVDLISGNAEDERRKAMDSALRNLAQIITDKTTSSYITNASVQVREDHSSWNPIAIIAKPITDGLAKSLTNLVKLDPVNPRAIRF